MSKWRPIETAPKDGTRILIARAGEEVGIGAVEITHWFEILPHYDYLPDDDHPGLYRRVKTADGYGMWNGNGHRATHWMPLPDPPEGER